MNENQSPIEVRRRRSHEESAQLVAEFTRSGLTRGEFCRQHGLSTGALDHYRKRHCQSGSSPASPGRLIPVHVDSPALAPVSGLAVALANGYRVEVSRGFDAQTLRNLVAVLETV